MNDIKRIIIVALGAAMIILFCFWIKEVADVEGWKTAYKYNIAIPAEKKDEFNYDVDSHQGLVITRGDFKTTKGTGFDHLDGKYTYAERVHEHYTMHTETYPCGTAKQPRTCTRTYWSWDYVDSTDVYAEKTTYFGREYPTSTFDFSNLKERVPGYYKQDWDDRYYFKVVPLSFTASFLVDTSNGTLQSPFSGKVKLEDKSIEQMRKDSTSYKLWNNVILVVVSILIVIGMSYAAYAWVMEDGVVDFLNRP